MISPAHTDTKPWFKYPLLWLVIFFPASAVVAGLITLAIAIKTDDGVVVDDYYRKGKGINLVLTRDKHAAKLGLNGHADYDPKNRQVIISIRSSLGMLSPENIRLQLLHTTRGKIDVDEELSITQQGNYFLTLPQALAQGGWIVQISTPAWRIHGKIAVPGTYSSPLAPL